MSDQAKFDEINQMFEKEFLSFKNKCGLMQQNTTKGREFYKNFLENLVQVNQALDEYQRYYEIESKKFYDEHKIAEIQLKKDVDFATNSDKYILTAKEDLDKKKKHFEEVRTSMRTSITNINSKKLSDLKVQENPSLLNLFKTLYSVLYKAGKDEFDWVKFKKNALIKDKCNDFISRAGNLDPLEVPKEKLEYLNAIKQDDWLKKFMTEDPKGDSVLFIMDYLEYIPECVKTEIEIADLEHNMKNIKRDAITRKYKVEILTKKIKILEDNYDHLAELFKKIMENKPWVLELMKQVEEKYEELGIYANKLTQEIYEIYDKDIQKVPNSLYE